MIEVRLPEISENVASGDVVKVLVGAGDSVVVEQPLIELETDKAVFEVPSPTAGVVSEITVSAGETVPIGAVIARIDAAKAAAATPGGDLQSTSTSGGEPRSGEAGAGAQDDLHGGTPRRPAAAELAAGDSGGRSNVADSPDAAVVDPSGTDQFRGPDAQRTPASSARSAQPAPSGQPLNVAPVTAGPVPASPTVRRLARELGVDIRRVPGSGDGGRVSAADVRRFAHDVIAGAGTSGDANAPMAARPMPDLSRYGDVERVPMSKIRKVTARNVSVAWNTVPAVTQNDVADITDLEKARKRYAPLAEKAGGKLTMTAILLKICSFALERFPDFNSAIDVAAGELVYRKYVHIAVAVDTEHGLLVPVLRDVNRKSAIELAVELGDLAGRARTRKLKPAEMEGAGFTISNLGGIGGTSFSPIVNTPEVAILGVSRASTRPIWRGEVFEPRLVLPLSLTYDHRVIDGAAAARFVRWICEALERPAWIAIDG